MLGDKKINDDYRLKLRQIFQIPNDPNNIYQMMKVDKPSFLMMDEYSLMGTIKFNHVCTAYIPVTVEEEGISKLYLYIKYKESDSKIINSLDELIYKINIIIGDKIYNSYTGKFLQLCSDLKEYPINIINSRDSITDAFIEIPMMFDSKKIFPSYYCGDTKIIIEIHFNNVDQSQSNVELLEAKIFATKQYPSNPYQFIKFMIPFENRESSKFVYKQIQFSGAENLALPVDKDGKRLKDYFKIPIYYSGDIETIMWTVYFQDKKGKKIQSLNEKTILKYIGLYIDGSAYLSRTTPALFFNGVTATNFNRGQYINNNPNNYVYTFALSDTDKDIPNGTLNLERYICSTRLISNAYLDICLEDDMYQYINNDIVLICEMYGIVYISSVITPSIGGNSKILKY